MRKNVVLSSREKSLVVFISSFRNGGNYQLYDE